MRVVLGNRHAIHTVRGEGGEDIVEKMPKGKRATVIDIPAEKSLAEAFRSITDGDGVWNNHATGDAKPAWVASDNEAMAMILAHHFGEPAVPGEDGKPGKPAQPIEIRELEETPGAGPIPLLLAMPSLLLAFCASALLLRTNAGADFQAKQMGGAASATGVAKYMGITANATAPAATDTTLTGEITTAGGGLVRAAGVYAHTTGAASYTITNTFTANGSDALPVTVNKGALFDAASAGAMVFETLLSAAATFNSSGDAATITQTVSL